MSITYGFHATMTARPGKSDETVDLLLAAAANASEDCLVFLVGRSATDPDVIHVTEGWTDEETHHTFIATPAAQEVVAHLRELLAGEPEYVDEVPIGGKAAI